LIAAVGMAQGGTQPVVKRVLADKIVAQVGDKYILYSDIANAISDAKRQGSEAQLPPNPECVFLEGQLVQKALVLQAEKDSLPLTDEDVDAAIDNKIRYFINQFGSKETVEEIAGKTVYQMKEDFRPLIREQLLAEQMRKKVLENVKITPTEVKLYYDKIPKDSLPFYESEVEVSQIILQPKAAPDVEEYISKQLYDFKRQVEAKTKSFEQLAKINSDDAETEKQGGILTLNIKDKFWDPNFLSASFKLKEGQISPVIKSKFGLHIIQLVARNGDDAKVRHILKIPPVTDGEIQEAVHKLDTIRTQIINRYMTFGEAVNKYSDEESSKFSGGAIQGRDGSTYITIDQLEDKDLVLALRDLKPGDYSKPLAYEERGIKKVRLIYLKTRTNPHRENLKEDYNKVAQRALDDKKQEKLLKWFSEHLPSYYISIDKEYNNCSSLNNWFKFAARN
jgi:peptidyl-prolyl cis-trans isomerase SurA